MFSKQRGPAAKVPGNKAQRGTLGTPRRTYSFLSRARYPSMPASPPTSITTYLSALKQKQQQQLATMPTITAKVPHIGPSPLSASTTPGGQPFVSKWSNRYRGVSSSLPSPIRLAGRLLVPASFPLPPRRVQLPA